MTDSPGARPERVNRRTKTVVFTNAGDRVLFKLLLVGTVIGFTRLALEPSVIPWPEDLPFLVFAAAAGWLSFRMGFRTRVVARADEFEVVNIFSAHRIPYPEVDEIVLDRLSVRFTLRSGDRVRAWGLGESFLGSRGSRGDDLVRRLGALREQRATPHAPQGRLSRVVFADWWVFVVLLIVFGAAVAGRQLISG